MLPDRIFLVRHAESEGNVDNFAYETIPDSQVPLVGGWVEDTGHRMVTQSVCPLLWPLNSP